MEDTTARTEDSDCASDCGKATPKYARNIEEGGREEPVVTSTEDPWDSFAKDVVVAAADHDDDGDDDDDDNELVVTTSTDQPLQTTDGDTADAANNTDREEPVSVDQPTQRSNGEIADVAQEDNFLEGPVVTSAHEPLQRVDEDEESDSELTAEVDYNLDAEPSSSSHSQSLSHNLSQQTYTLLSKASGHSRGSQTSNGSLKIFRKPTEWKNSGHDSLSFLEPFDNDLDESENAADEDDLKVLCSRDSKRLKLLGEGAFGQVWLVRHNHKSYALKVASKYDLLAEGAVHELVREREIMSQLDHPFIARLWATNQDHDFVYILEDYLAGGELFSVLERAGGKIAPSVAQICK